MSVWYAIPSVRDPITAGYCLAQWKLRGYKVAVLRQGEPIRGEHQPDLVIPTDHYRGWAGSVNFLSTVILTTDHTAQWLVTGGDDYFPDMNKTAQEIADDIKGGIHVMQPTGDRYGDGYIDKAAASPWLSRAWCMGSVYNAPLPPYYRHFYADQELQEVATKLKCFQQRLDIVQEHRHWSRAANPVKPEFLEDVGQAGDREIFLRRKRNGFYLQELPDVRND